MAKYFGTKFHCPKKKIEGVFGPGWMKYCPLYEICPNCMHVCTDIINSFWAAAVTSSSLFPMAVYILI